MLLNDMLPDDAGSWNSDKASRFKGMDGEEYALEMDDSIMMPSAYEANVDKRSCSSYESLGRATPLELTALRAEVGTLKKYLQRLRHSLSSVTKERDQLDVENKGLRIRMETIEEMNGLVQYHNSMSRSRLSPSPAPMSRCVTPVLSPSALSHTRDLPVLEREDYPDINAEKERKDSSDGREGTTRGKSCTAKGEMSWHDSLVSRNAHPPSWGKATTDVSRQYRNEMKFRFPVLAFCDNNWKVEQIATNNYPSWYLTKFGKKIKHEPINEEMANITLKRPHSPSSIPSALPPPPPKHTKMETSTPAAAQQMQVSAPVAAQQTQASAPATAQQTQWLIHLNGQPKNPLNLLRLSLDPATLQSTVSALPTLSPSAPSLHVVEPPRDKATPKVPMASGASSLTQPSSILPATTSATPLSSLSPVPQPPNLALTVESAKEPGHDSPIPFTSAASTTGHGLPEYENCQLALTPTILVTQPTPVPVRVSLMDPS
ncbi:hypothetical protein DXG01_003590 [Tephrocybe rancida]|nr:hypothetical protein DXG01_003590 [Tephrocybe rancida]